MQVKQFDTCVVSVVLVDVELTYGLSIKWLVAAVPSSVIWIVRPPAAGGYPSRQGL